MIIVVQNTEFQEINNAHLWVHSEVTGFKSISNKPWNDRKTIHVNLESWNEIRVWNWGESALCSARAEIHSVSTKEGERPVSSFSVVQIVKFSVECRK